MGLPIQGVQVVIVAFIGTLAITALGLRLWSRKLQRITLAFNDYMAILAMILATATVSICLADVFIGAIGVHSEELRATRPWVLTLYTKFGIPRQIFWASANTSVKLSILSLYTIIFPDKVFRRFCHATMAISAAYFISVFLETLLLRQPTQYNRDKTIPNGKCANQGIASTTAGVTNLVVDAFIVALPIPRLYGLQVPLAKRISIGAMFGLGALICIFSLLRIISLRTWDLKDMTYTGTRVAIYSILEPTLGLVNACLPTTRPALRRLFNNDPFSWSQKSFSKSQGRQPSLDKNDPYPHQFERLEDDFASTNIHATRSHQGVQHDGNNIAVMREWEVRLTHLGDGSTTMKDQGYD
ncbi:hypothetical protein F4801DRAFT_214981 [Xylaria longipes]|nr:hypothetical protein F4801DRAFT_214981 [Xylaria longipes]